MSSPGDRPDDPDEVTLWAGRLRGWAAQPAPETAEAVEGATPRPRAGRPDAATSTPDGNPPADEIDDATVISPNRVSPPPDDATVVSHPRGPVDGPDDATVISPHRAPAHAPDDDTVRREPLDDRTLRRPGIGVPGDDVPGAGVPDDDTAPGRRTRRPSTPTPDDELDETNRPRRPIDDDTRAGSRRARRSDAAATAAPGGPSPSGSPATTRDARVPSALEREIYAPRTDAPVRVERATPRPPAASAGDAALVRPATARRAAWRALLIGVVVVVLAGAAVAAIVLLG